MPQKPSRSQAKTPRKRRLVDRRLLGRWKSDRRRTFHNWALPRATPGGLRKFKALFGKMTVTWGPRTVTSELNGVVDIEPYEIVAQDDLSVVVRVRSEYSWLFGELRQIWIDGDHYHLCAAALPIVEHFRKLDDRGTARKTKKANHG